MPLLTQYWADSYMGLNSKDSEYAPKQMRPVDERIFFLGFVGLIVAVALIVISIRVYLE